mgnify:CR=1 FL=1
MSVRYKKIEDSPHLIKDTLSKAVINTNVEGYRAAKLRKERYKENQKLKDNFKTLENKINALEKLLVNR